MGEGLSLGVKGEAKGGGKMFEESRSFWDFSGWTENLLDRAGGGVKCEIRTERARVSCRWFERIYSVLKF